MNNDKIKEKVKEIIESYCINCNEEDVLDQIHALYEEEIKKMRSELRAEINNNFWNKIIPQANKDILDKFIELLEKEDLTVAVDKLHDNKKFYSVRLLKEKFINSLSSEK